MSANIVDDMVSGGPLSLSKGSDHENLMNLVNKNGRSFHRIEIDPPDDAIVFGNVTVADFRAKNGRDPVLGDFAAFDKMRGVAKSKLGINFLSKGQQDQASDMYLTANGWDELGEGVFDAASDAGLNPSVRTRQRILFAEYADQYRVAVRGDTDSFDSWREEGKDPSEAESLTDEQRAAQAKAKGTEIAARGARKRGQKTEGPDTEPTEDEINQAADQAAADDAPGSGDGGEQPPSDMPRGEDEQLSIHNIRKMLDRLHELRRNPDDLAKSQGKQLNAMIAAFERTLEETFKRAAPTNIGPTISRVMQEYSDFEQNINGVFGEVFTSSIGELRDRRGHYLTERQVQRDGLEPSITEGDEGNIHPDTPAPSYAVYAVYDNFKKGDRSRDPVFDIAQIQGAYKLVGGFDTEGAAAWRGGVLEQAINDARRPEGDLQGLSLIHI